MQDARTSPEPFYRRHVWIIVAALCLVAALALWPAVGADAAFVAAALGVVAWFCNVREGLKRQNPEAFADVETADEDEDEQDGRVEN